MKIPQCVICGLELKPGAGMGFACPRGDCPLKSIPENLDSEGTRQAQEAHASKIKQAQDEILKAARAARGAIARWEGASIKRDGIPGIMFGFWVEGKSAMSKEGDERVRAMTWLKECVDAEEALRSLSVEGVEG